MSKRSRPASVITPAETPPAETPPAETPPAETPPAETPPAETPPAATPPATDGENDLVEVILTIGLSGVAQSWAPGEPYLCSATEARRLRDAGYAEPE